MHYNLSINKRSKDYFIGISIEMYKELVADVKLSVTKYEKEDKSVTLNNQYEHTSCLYCKKK